MLTLVHPHFSVGIQTTFRGTAGKRKVKGVRVAYNWVLPRTPLRGADMLVHMRAYLQTQFGLLESAGYLISGHGTCTPAVGGPGTFDRQANGALEVVLGNLDDADFVPLRRCLPDPV